MHLGFKTEQPSQDRQQIAHHKQER